MTTVIAIAKAFPLYSIVQVTKSLNPMKGGYLWHSPFKDKGTFHVVTGYQHAGDLILDNNPAYSVSPLRVSLVDASIYAITDKMTEDLGGMLGKLPVGERFAVIYGTECGQYSAVIQCLDRKTQRTYYTDSRGEWINELLKAGAIVKGTLAPGIPLRWYVRQPNGVDAGPLFPVITGNDDKPEQFNSVFDAPVGMVLRYTVEGETAVGAVHPYVMRTGLGLWVYGGKDKNWRFIPLDSLGVSDVPYMHNLQGCWAIPVCWQEAFEYPAQSPNLNNHRNNLIKVANNA